MPTLLARCTKIARVSEEVCSACMSLSAHNALAYFMVTLRQFARPLYICINLTQNHFHKITDFKGNLEVYAFSEMNEMISYVGYEL
jgi:hypothetical protein